MKTGLEMDYNGELSAYELLMECRDAMMQKVVGLVEKCKNARSVLITGENGTGKELVANALNERGDRKGRSFVTVDCANLNPSIMGSELFGHEKGAFTGASDRKIGLFEAAENGTAFLDEIGEIPLDVQHRLLRVLQGQSFNRVGGTQPIKPSFRLITATNRDLAQMVAEGKFRRDLYYRITVFRIPLPPLWQRKSDIIRLANHFIDEFSGKTKMLDPEVEGLLLGHTWPGNVRELKNVMERAVTFANGERTVTRDHIDILPSTGVPVSVAAIETELPAEGSFQDEVDRIVARICSDGKHDQAVAINLLKTFEAMVIRSALKIHNSNRSAAANDLGIGRPTLYKKIGEYHIED